MNRQARQQLAELRDRLFPRSDVLGCAKKQRYVTEELALRVLNCRKRNGAGDLFHYHCSQCDGWHLTKLEQPE